MRTRKSDFCVQVSCNSCCRGCRVFITEMKLAVKDLAIRFAGVILIFGGIQITSLAMGQMTSSLGLPIGVFYVILPISGFINIIYTILNIVDIATDSELVEREG